MTEMTVVPTLVRGAWHPGTGVGCAMQLRNWMQAGGPVRGFNKSKYANLSDRRDSMLAVLNHVVIAVNDTYCAHLTKMTVCEPVSLKTLEVDKLCSECTIWLMELIDVFDNTSSLATVANANHLRELNSLANSAMMSAREVLNGVVPGYAQEHNRWVRKYIKNQVTALVHLVKLMKEQAKEIPSEPTLAQLKIDRKFDELTKLQAMMISLNASAEHAKAAAKSFADLHAKAVEVGT